VAEQGAHLGWTSWDDSTSEEFSLRWENGAWVAESTLVGPDVHYVARVAPDGAVRQFLLFRDLDEPDLWLVTDGNGRWAEMNGSEREELRGCEGIFLGCSPSSVWAHLRSLDVEVGESGNFLAASIDVETLAVEAVEHVYTRIGERRWRLTAEAAVLTVEFDVDDEGFVTDAPGWFRRGEVALP
jgi:hypothetical protein